MVALSGIIIKTYIIYLFLITLNKCLIFCIIINLLMVYTCKHTLYQLSNPLQFPHEPPGVHQPHFRKPWSKV